MTVRARLFAYAAVKDQRELGEDLSLCDANAKSQAHLYLTKLLLQHNYRTISCCNVRFAWVGVTRATKVCQDGHRVPSISREPLDSRVLKAGVE
jgi:hypothetical protein